MELRKIVDSWEDDSRGLDRVPLTWHYELRDIVPNAEGFYEVPKSVHHVYPALDAQRELEKHGFIYVGHKKGNYDIELWRCVQEVAPQSDTVTLPGQSVIIHKDDAAKLEELSAPVVHPANYAQRPTLDPTNTKCYMCGTEIASSTFRIVGARNAVKDCVLQICMNPLCSFHYVTMERK